MKYRLLMVMAALAAMAVGCGDDEKARATDTPGFPVVDAEPGTCGAMAEDDVLRTRFVAVPCAGEHKSEVAGSYELTGEDYPGQSELRLQTQLECRPFFEQYVGTSYWESDFDLATLPPAKSAWAMGDRKVVCLIVGKDGAMLEGPARGSRR
ncbi:MAG TPA: septum formation family protein [Myxococcota bacterium]|nr:septum formation family protein [Myxococcota bacterium]